MPAHLTRGRLARVMLAAWLLCAAISAAAEVAVPPLKSRVTDLTATLKEGERAALEAKLADFEQKKGSQIAILVVPTTQPETVEQYAIRVFDQWKLGRSRVDDGVLLLVAKDDRRLRIEVGRGLEGAIPDAFAKRIIEEAITPRFRQGDFYGGISAGVDRIVKLAEGEPMPAPQARSPAPHGGLSPEVLFIGFMVVTVLANLLRSLMGRGAGSGVVGVAVGTIVYFFSGLLAVAVIVGIIVFIFSLFGGTGTGHRGSWSSGSGWSSGGGSWSSGGGFSGGGGSSSGGGASGSW